MRRRQITNLFKKGIIEGTLPGSRKTGRMRTAWPWIDNVTYGRDWSLKT